MNSSVRRNVQMGTHARDVNASRPDTDAGAVAAAGKLGTLLHRAEILLVDQREGLVEVHAASVEKEKLRREILAGPIANLSAVGKVAGTEQHELRSTFRFKPSGSSFLAFSTAGRSMAAEAETHREVLIKHGLATPMLEQLGQLLDRFDAAVAMGASGKRKHVGATGELKTIAREIAQTVRVLDGRNRQRFQDDGQLLAAWINASTVTRAPQVAKQPDTLPSSAGSAVPAGDVSPAA